MKIVSLLFSILLLAGFASNAAARKITFKKVKTMPEGVTSKLDIPYNKNNNPGQKLDIYFPEKKDKAFTVLMHIHGGGWMIGDKKMMKATGMFYASRGVLFVTPNYRLSPKVKHPTHVEDCAKALAWVFEHMSELGGNKNRVFLSGHSAGAHLAALLGTNEKYLQKHKIKPGDLAGVIPVDTASFNLLSNENEKAVKRMVTRAFGRNKNILKDASPFYNVTGKKEYPKFLILNTMNRENAVRAGEEFSRKLKNSGCDSTFIPVKDHTHREMAAGMYDESDPVGEKILEFIFSK